MNWPGIMFGLAASGAWTIGVGQFIKNNDVQVIGALALFASIVIFLVLLIIMIIAKARGDRFDWGGRRGRRRRRRDYEPEAREQPKEGFREEDIRLRIFDEHGNLLERSEVETGSWINFEIRTIDDNVSFIPDSRRNVIEIRDSTNNVIIQRLTPRRNQFSNRRRCLMGYQIPRTYPAGPREGQPIRGKIEIAVRVNFPTEER